MTFLAKVKRKNKFIFVLSITAIILIVSALSTFLIYINSSAFRENAKNIITAQIENSFGNKIEIGAIEYISFRTIRLNDFKIFEEDATEKESILFQARNVKAEFTLLLPILRWQGWQLSIKNITFDNATTTFTRLLNGDFDIVEKLHINPELLQENIQIGRIYFQDSKLTYHDELIYNYKSDYLTTKAEKINGYFDLSQLPKINIEFAGYQEEDNAYLSLQGYFSVLQPEYSLDFYLENAEITHFQYYLEIAEIFNVNRGKFNINFNLSNLESDPSAEIDWKGEATFQEAELSPHFMHQIPFQKVNGSIRFVKPQINIDRLDGLYRDESIQLTGFVLTEPEVFFDLRVDGKEIDATLLKNDLTPFLPEYNDFSLKGKIDISANLKGNPEDFQIKGQANSDDIIFEKILLPNIDCSFLLHQDKLLIDYLKITEKESSLTLEGEINELNSIPLYELSLNTKNFSLQNSIFSQLSFLDLKKITGKIDSLLQIKNYSQDNSDTYISGSFTINSFQNKDFFSFNKLQGNINTVLNSTKKILAIQQGEIVEDDNKLKFEGEINFQNSESMSYSLDFYGYLPELNDFSKYLGFETNIKGNANINGVLQSVNNEPELKATFDVENFSIQELTFNIFSGKIFYQENAFIFDSLFLENQKIQLNADGQILLSDSKNPEFKFTYNFPSMNITSITEQISSELPLSGEIEGNGSISGIWPQLSLEGYLQLSNIALQEYKLGQGNLNFTLQPEDNLQVNKESVDNYYLLLVKDLKLQNDLLQLNAKGQSKVTEEFPFSLEIDFIHGHLYDAADYFYLNNQYYKSFLPSKTVGKIILNGDIDSQQIDLSAKLTPQEMENNPPSQLELTITNMDDELLISNFKLTQSEGILEAKGSIQLEQKLLDINFQTQKLDISTLSALLNIDEKIEGIMNIKGSCSGAISDPDISLYAQINQGFFRNFQFDNLQSEMYWDGNTNELKIKDFLIFLEKDYKITAKGNLPLDTFLSESLPEKQPDLSYQQIPLDFQINMEKTNLNLLSLFFVDCFSAIGGNVDVELKLSGTNANPIINGNIDVLEGSFDLIHFPIQAKNINSHLEIKNNKIEIPSTPFIAYDNQFTIFGKLELINFLPENIDLTMQNQNDTLFYQDILESKIDFSAALNGNFLQPCIIGNIKISDGEINLTPLMQLYENDNRIPSPLPNYYDDSQKYLDMNIEISDHFSLKLPNADINAAGNINLSGSLKEPTIQGSLILKEGHLYYFENKFTISGGRIILNGSAIDDINIDARAQTTVQDYSITINISGNLTNPQVMLSSQPALKETEILSLLAFNRNIEGLSEGEINQILSQEIVDIIFQSLQINLFKRMERGLAEGLGLEFFRLSYDLPENTNGSLFFLDDLSLGDLKLEVGKNINEDLLITYSTPLDFHGETSFGINYEISPKFTFNSQLDTFSFKENDYRFKFGLEVKF